MEFDFIDNSPANEAEREQVIKLFVDFIKNVLMNTAAKDFEMENNFSSTKSLELQEGDLRIAIQERFFETKENPVSEIISYEIDLNLSHFSDSRATIYSETYLYYEDNLSQNYVERMTGRMNMDGKNMNHNTEKHEVGKGEITKMLSFVRQKLEDKK